MTAATPPVVVDVVIVGAGLSGLWLARALVRRGRSVLVLEASERVGGRIRSAVTGVELGAQLVSLRQKRVLALAAELGLEIRALRVRGRDVHVRVDPGGTLRRGDRRLGCADAVDLAQAVVRFAALLARREAHGWMTSESIEAYVERVSCRPATRAALLDVFSAGFCVEGSRVSVAEAVDQIRSMGGLSSVVVADSHGIVGGPSALVEGLLDPLRDVVVTGAAVTAVHQEATGVILKTADGRTFAGHAAVISVPMHLVDSIDFVPTLPSWRRAHHRSMVVGRVTKTVAVYPRPWWRAAGFSGTISTSGSIFSDIIDTSNADAAGRGVLVAFSQGTRADAIGVHDLAWRREALDTMLTAAFGILAPEPEAFFSTDWTSQPFIGGGYASRSGLCQVSSAEGAAAVHRVHFSGTESAAHWRSYMEGALESAQRVLAELVGVDPQA